jgi:hypothetical protein
MDVAGLTTALRSSGLGGTPQIQEAAARRPRASSDRHAGLRDGGEIGEGVICRRGGRGRRTGRVCGGGDARNWRRGLVERGWIDRGWRVSGGRG